jgi:hypothetical protein
MVPTIYIFIKNFVYIHLYILITNFVYIRFYARLLLLFICKMMIPIVIFIKNIKFFSSMEPQSRDTYAHTQYNPEISPTQTEKWLNAPVAHLGFEFDSQYEWISESELKICLICFMLKYRSKAGIKLLSHGLQYRHVKVRYEFRHFLDLWEKIFSISKILEDVISRQV